MEISTMFPCDSSSIPKNQRRTVVYELSFATELPAVERLRDVLPGTGEAVPQPPDLSRFSSPLNWTNTEKNITIYTSLVITVLTAYAIGSYSPGVDQMMDEWNISSTESSLGITIFIYGIGIAPMFLAPFSELYGRKSVVLASGGLFVIGQVCSGLTRNFGGMLVSRLLAGIGGSTFSTMVGGIISDVYEAKQRNTPMTLQAAAALLGTGLGPLVSGFIAQHTSWRWIFYSQSVVGSLAVIAVVLFFQETRGGALLHSKAEAFNEWYKKCEEAGYYDPEVLRLHTISRSPNKRPAQVIWRVNREHDRPALSTIISISCYRPFHLLLTEPIIIAFSIYVSFSWGILYLALEAIPLVLKKEYKYTLSQANAMFGAVIIGSILAPIASITQDIFYTSWTERHESMTSRGRFTRHLRAHARTPEHRLYFACWASSLMVAGLFIFGYTTTHHLHIVIPGLAIVLETVGIFSVYLAAFNYLADSYGLYASSAIAGQSFCRQMLSGAFPLFTKQMYEGMGYGRACYLLGGLGAVLMVVPWGLVMKGEYIRRKSKFAVALSS